MESGKQSRVLHAADEAAISVAQALASAVRIQILHVLALGTLNISEVAEKMRLPYSTVTFHLNQLHAAGLISFETEKGTRGSQRLCSRIYDEVHLRLPGTHGTLADPEDTTVATVSMPIGNYRHVQASPSCGLASDAKLIGYLDDPRSFFDPDHVNAQILWFREGYVEYAFPNGVPHGATASSIELSMELCSEAPGFALKWPSDITLWINDVEVGTWTSPGDFGGRAAMLTPKWWHVDQTTFGLLKRWTVTEQGSMIDGLRVSKTSVSQLKLDEADFIKVRIGVKSDARNCGGMNLFGRKFGNYAQDILMRIEHRPS